MFNYFGSMPTEDKLIYKLSELYERYGYRKYCMAKFEEYSFYSDNRDFLSGEGVIAFNNSDGRLMALKPDITLSIVKNATIQKHSFTKTYYNENVYRISPQTHDYKEIKQTGVELLGEIDDYSVAEIVMLAVKSLGEIDKNNVLGISHMAFIGSVLDEMNIPSSAKKDIIFCEKNKNAHDIRLICERFGVDNKNSDYLASLAMLDGDFSDILEYIRKSAVNEASLKACDELSKLYDALKAAGCEKNVKPDMSVVNPSSYYNGIVFNGYVKNSPSSVLAGGRYDNLAGKIRKGIGAIGFAVYLDNLNLYYPIKKEADSDVLIINKSSDCGVALIKKTEELISRGKGVRVERKLPEGYVADIIYEFDGENLKEVK